METDLPWDLRGHYQLPDASMTLREGLEEYYRVNPGLSDPAEITDPTSALYFRNHDSTHVVFGTHTGPLHEGINDLWTIMGVDIRFREYAGGFFATDESKTIAKQLDLGSILPLLWRSLRLWPEIRRRTRAMARKWPWTPPTPYLDRPLKDLREEFGIRVMRPEVELGLDH